MLRQVLDRRLPHARELDWVIAMHFEDGQGAGQRGFGSVVFHMCI